MERLELTPGYRISLKNGTLTGGDYCYMAMEEQLLAYPGDRLVLLNDEYEFAVALYLPKRLKRLIYAYGYAKEGNWTIYTHNLHNDSFSDSDFLIRKERYFRVVVVRKDGKAMSEEDMERRNEIVGLELCEEEKPTKTIKPWFRKEIDAVSARINDIKGQIANPFSLLLLADSHYTVNGTWDETAANINEVASMVDYDGIVHLGDLTDGMLSKKLTSKYVKKILNNLKNTGKPVYVTIGNHDRNYFKNKDRVLTTDEMRKVYEIPSEKNLKHLDYYIDYEDKKLRLIFMESFDNNRFFTYGYSDSQIEWLKNVMKKSKKGTRFIIFSHDTPCGMHDVTSIHTNNGKRFLNVLEHYNGLNGFKILGLFYGHTHADFVYKGYSFPLISINSCKLEYFNELKPKGAVRWYKEAGSVTQDSWDSLIVDLDSGKLNLVRFGAGEDRFI